MNIAVLDSDNWREIGATLARNKTRTFMTAFGIFWGTAMLALLWGGAKGFQDLLMRNFDGFATNMAVVSSARTTMPHNGFNKGQQWPLTTEDVADIRRYVAGIDVISSYVSRPSRSVSYAQKSTTAGLQGVEAQFSRIMEPVIYEGRFINDADNRARAKVCTIGKKVASELFGVKSPLGEYVNVGGIYYLVVGVVGQTSEVNLDGSKLDDSVIIPLSVMQVSYNTGRDIDIALFTAVPGRRPSDLTDRIRRVVRTNHPNLHPDDDNAFWFMDISEQFEMLDNLFVGVSLLALFVGAGTLLAGVIGVGNIMWIIVKERTREIGIRRAIGAKPADIIMQILSESMVLTTIAGAAGIVFASIILGIPAYVYSSDIYATPRFELPFATSIIILLLFLVLGTAAGIVPALRSMRIKPIEALNDK